MADIKEECRELIYQALETLRQKKQPQLPVLEKDSVIAETPPKPEMGDVGFPLFIFAKQLRMAPPAIAAELLTIIASMPESAGMGEFSAQGPYVNVLLKKDSLAARVLQKIRAQGNEYGSLCENGTKPLAGRRVMVEFSSPNTNKPLHLGHLRNDALGESVSRCLKAAGADVFKVNIINNRGVHICKSMLAYRKFHCPPGKAPDTPETAGVKSDRFVGDCYVEFEKYRKENEGTAEAEAQNLLIQWEKGDREVYALWKQMNDWAISGIRETYARTGISFDKFYYESDTYLKGREEILKGLESGLFYRREDGAVMMDLAEIGLDKKVLLRSDGTAVYITQDIGTAIFRRDDWKFNQLVYVVGSEQIYHFKVLFFILKKLGYTWADQLYHLSYGMVNLPEGRMKSREGTVVDADDLINNLRDGALEEIAAKGREEAVGDPGAVAEKIALGALHYYLLQATPSKDMLFNPKESLSFNGNTGPYLQYMGARISSIVRRAETENSPAAGGSVNPALLTHETEWELIKTLDRYPAAVEKAAETLNPAEIASYLYEVSRAFSSFYHECPILSAQTPDLAATRLELARAVRTVLKNAMELILVPFLETM